MLSTEAYLGFSRCCVAQYVSVHVSTSSTYVGVHVSTSSMWVCTSARLVCECARQHV